MAAHNETGRRAEAAACRYLEGQGLQLLERNYACPQGEIDLIMRHAETLVFVEVRYRRDGRFGDGMASVDRRKQARLAASAAHYLQQHPRAARRPCRFDVVALSGGEQGRARVNWVADAFQT